MVWRKPAWEWEEVGETLWWAEPQEALETDGLLLPVLRRPGCQRWLWEWLPGLLRSPDWAEWGKVWGR